MKKIIIIGIVAAVLIVSLVFVLPAIPLPEQEVPYVETAWVSTDGKIEADFRASVACIDKDGNLIPIYAIPDFLSIFYKGKEVRGFAYMLEVRINKAELSTAYPYEHFIFDSNVYKIQTAVVDPATQELTIGFTEQMFTVTFPNIPCDGEYHPLGMAVKDWVTFEQWLKDNYDPSFAYPDGEHEFRSVGAAGSTLIMTGYAKFADGSFFKGDTYYVEPILPVLIYKAEVSDGTPTGSITGVN